MDASSRAQRKPSQRVKLRAPGLASQPAGGRWPQSAKQSGGAVLLSVCERCAAAGPAQALLIRRSSHASHAKSLPAPSFIKPTGRVLRPPHLPCTGVLAICWLSLVFAVLLCTACGSRWLRFLRTSPGVHLANVPHCSRRACPYPWPSELRAQPKNTYPWP